MCQCVRLMTGRAAQPGAQLWQLISAEMPSQFNMEVPLQPAFISGRDYIWWHTDCRVMHPELLLHEAEMRRDDIYRHAELL